MVGGGQQIKLDHDRGCAKIPGIVVHEILHSLGFFHMHMHSNRDNYIKINWENIPEHLHPNYKFISSSTASSFKTKYDFFSIMHYPSLTLENKLAIEPLDKYAYYEKFMGQRKSLSTGDIARVNNMYKCETNDDNNDDDDSNDNENVKDDDKNVNDQFEGEYEDELENDSDEANGSDDEDE